MHSAVVHEAAARLLLASVVADGGMPAVMLLPAVLSQLSLPAEVQLQVVNGCRQMLAGMPAEARNADWIQCTEVIYLAT